MVFTACKRQIIGDSDVELIGVNGDGDENEVALKIENENNLDYQEDQEEVNPKQEDQTIIGQPIKLELKPSEEVPTRIVQVPES